MTRTIGRRWRQRFQRRRRWHKVLRKVRDEIRAEARTEIGHFPEARRLRDTCTCSISLLHTGFPRLARDMQQEKKETYCTKRNIATLTRSGLS